MASYFMWLRWQGQSGSGSTSFGHGETAGRCSGSHPWTIGERGQVSDHAEAFDRKDEGAG